MDHAYAQEHDVYAAYLAGKLGDEDREAFEAHYFDCAECLLQLETAEEFGAGMRDLAAAAVSASQARMGLLAALARLNRRSRFGIALLLLFLVAAPAYLWLRFLAQPPDGASARLDASRRTISTLEARLRNTDAGAERQRRTLLAQLDAARAALAAQEASPGSAAGAPQVNVPLFTLAAVRGAAEDGSEPDPINRIVLPRGAPSLVLTLELATLDTPTYRVRLRAEGPRGRELWQAGGLRPNAQDTLVLLLPAPLLPPGLYDLELEGEAAGGGRVPVGRYPFRVEGRR